MEIIDCKAAGIAPQDARRRAAEVFEKVKLLVPSAILNDTVDFGFGLLIGNPETGRGVSLYRVIGVDDDENMMPILCEDVEGIVQAIAKP